MKKINVLYPVLIMLVIMVVTGNAVAQKIYEEDITVTLTDPNRSGELDIENHNGKVNVEGYDGKDILIHIRGYPESQKEEKSRDGLRRIPTNSMNVEITEEDNYVEIDGGNKRTDFIVKVPRQFSLYIGTHHNGDVTVSNVTGEMEIDCHHGGMVLEDVGGSLVADTHHGEIKANFLSTTDKPMAFSTYHGDVDITFPASTVFDVKVKTEKGDIFTDFDVKFNAVKPSERTDDGRKEIKIGGWMQGQVGSGGKEYMFNSYHGDILIRKS